MVVVDTTVWIDYINGADKPACDWLDREIDLQRIGLTDLTLCELLQGVRDESKADALQITLTRFALISTGGEVLAVAVRETLRMNRIAIIGTTGSGKSTLARQLAAKLVCPCVDLDDLGWDANWVMPPDDVLRMRVDSALRPDEHWITSGNRAVVRGVIWGRADTLVWLDYAFPLVLWRLTTRTLRRIATQETVCNGNHETWRDVFWVHPRDTLFYYAIKTHWRRRRELPLALAQPEYQHLALVHLRSPKDATGWLTSI